MLTSRLIKATKHPFILFDGLNCKYFTPLTISSFCKSVIVIGITGGASLIRLEKEIINEIINEKKKQNHILVWK